MLQSKNTTVFIFVWHEEIICRVGTFGWPLVHGLLNGLPWIYSKWATVKFEGNMNSCNVRDLINPNQRCYWWKQLTLTLKVFYLNIWTFDTKLLGDIFCCIYHGCCCCLSQPLTKEIRRNARWRGWRWNRREVLCDALPWRAPKENSLKCNILWQLGPDVKVGKVGGLNCNCFDRLYLLLGIVKTLTLQVFRVYRSI